MRIGEFLSFLHVFLSVLFFLGRIPYLQLRVPGAKKQRDPVLSFGPVAVGKSSQKHFEIFNPSPVTHTHSHMHPSRVQLYTLQGSYPDHSLYTGNSYFRSLPADWLGALNWIRVQLSHDRGGSGVWWISTGWCYLHSRCGGFSLHSLLISEMQRSADWTCTEAQWKLCWYGIYNT